MENGVSSGDIAIDSTFVEGGYVVLSWTNNETFVLDPFGNLGRIFLGAGCGVEGVADTFGNGIVGQNLEFVNEDGLRIKI